MLVHFEILPHFVDLSVRLTGKLNKYDIILSLYFRITESPNQTRHNRIGNAIENLAARARLLTFCITLRRRFGAWKL